MPKTPTSDFRPGDRIVLVGTMKGAFLFRGGGRGYELVGAPHFQGHAVYALAYDDRGDAAAATPGPRARSSARRCHWSDDLGRTWTEPRKPNVRFPADTGLARQADLADHARARRRARTSLYCGVNPASLFESRDRGQDAGRSCAASTTTRIARSGRRAAGACACTRSSRTPRTRRRMLVAISTGGVYRTVDGGRTWQASNKGIRAEFLPDKHPEFGQCVHKVVQHPAPARALLPAEPLGPLPQRRRRRELEGHRERRALRLRLRDGRAPARPRHRLHRARSSPTRFRCTPEAQAARLPHARRGRLVEAAHPGPAPEGRLGDGAARRALRRLRPAGRRSTSAPAAAGCSPRATTAPPGRCLADGLPPVTCVRAALVGRRRGPAVQEAPARRRSRRARSDRRRAR